MTQSIQPNDMGVVHKYVATFTQAEMVQVASSSPTQQTGSYEVHINNPPGDANAIVIVRDGSGAVLPGLDTVSVTGLVIHVDAELAAIGPEPFSVTIFG